MTGPAYDSDTALDADADQLAGSEDGVDAHTDRPVVSIIMPVYNEERNLPRVLDEALSTMSAADVKYEIVIVDDASTDGSLKILQEYARRHPQVLRLVQHPVNRGIAAAFRTLDAAARGEFIFLIGSDGQWRIAECLRMLEQRGDCDIVVGRRVQKQYSPLRKLISGAFNLVPVLLFGVRTYDAGSIKLYRSEIARIPLVSRGVFDEAERLIRAQKRGYRIGVIDVEHLPRTSGRASGVRPKLIVGAVLDLFRCWWHIMVCGRA